MFPPHAGPVERPDNRPGRKGFTVLELIAVIGVVGLVLALAAPRLMSLERMNLKSDAGRVSTLLRYVSEAAMTKRLYYRVSFDLEGGSLIVERSADGREFSQEGEQGIRGLRMSRGVVLRDLVVQGLGKIERGSVSVLFTPLGAADEFTVHLAAGKEAFTVRFNPYSGRTEVKEGYA